MGIAFAGVELLLEDPDGMARDWLDRYLSLAELQLMGCAPAAISNPLPIVNYPPSLRPRINVLHWPTGATRWGSFLGLASTPDMLRIVQKCQPHAGNASQDFQITCEVDGETRTLTAPMHLLQPRPIGVPSRGASTLWLIPLVDARWYWQQRSGDFVVCGSSTTGVTWDGLLSQLADVLGVQFSASSLSIDARYQRPDPASLGLSGLNAAAVLDAACWSIGHRFVRDLDGTCHVMSWGKSKEVYEANTDTPSRRILFPVAGGELNPFAELTGGVDTDGETPKPDNLTTQTLGMATLYPEMVRLVCPSFDGGQHFEDVEFEDAIGNTDIDSTYGAAAGSVLTIESTCLWAPYSSLITDDVTDLATAVAEDVYRSLQHRFDQTFAGIANWNQSGYDDSLLVVLGRHADGSDQCFTRVQSLPGNVWLPRLLHQRTGIRMGETMRGFWNTTDGATWPKGETRLVAIYSESPVRQSLNFYGPTAGATFTLSFRGETTAVLAAGATAAQVETALNALSTVLAVGGVTCTSGGDATTYGRPPVRIDFPNTYAYRGLPLIQVSTGAFVSVTRDLEASGGVLGVFNPFATVREERWYHVVRVGRRYELGAAEC